MPPKNPKPLRPSQRGEKWELTDGSKVTLLEMLGRGVTSPVYHVINQRGFTESVFESQFRRRLYPPQGEGDDHKTGGKR